MALRINSGSDFLKTRSWLKRLIEGDIFDDLDAYGRAGVDALARETPVDTGITAESWGYFVIRDKNSPGVTWFNTNTVNGTPIVILIQYGHGTGTGGYVPGYDFINPTMEGIFDQIADNVWRRISR